MARTRLSDCAGGRDRAVWTVEVTVSFEASPGPIKANLYIPGLTPGFAILEENFVSRGFGFTPNYVSGGRQVQWARRRARGLQTLYYRAVIYKDPAQIETDTTPPFPPKPRLGEPFNTAMEVLIEDVGAKSADAESFTEELLKRLGQPDVDQNVELLLGPSPSADWSARARRRRCWPRREFRRARSAAFTCRIVSAARKSCRGSKFTTVRAGCISIR